MGINNAGTSSIPVRLRRLQRWMVWSLTDRGKQPLRPISTLDVEHLLSWEEVKDLEVSAEGGPGFCFTGGVYLADGTLLTCLDLDGCLCPLTGAVAPWAREVLARCGHTYVTTSPSGTGLHVWLRVHDAPDYMPVLHPADGSALPGIDKRPELQVFGLGVAHYITETGALFEDSQPEIGVVKDLEWLLELFGTQVDRVDRNGSAAMPVGTGQPPSFDEIREKVEQAADGPELLAGEWGLLGYPSASEGAWELAKHVLRAAGNHGVQAVAFLVAVTAWGTGMVESKDPGKYGKSRWWEKDVCRLAVKQPEHTRRVADVFDELPGLDLELEPDEDGDPVLLRASLVKQTEVDWLWHGRFPTGRISLISAPPGAGKSYLTQFMAACVSKGTTWPDKMPCQLGSAVLVSCEDDAGDTIVPRLAACGANLERIHILTGVHRINPRTNQQSITAFTLADLEPLNRALGGLKDARLVVIDPIGSYFGRDRDSHVDTEVRSLLAPLARVAASHRVAMVLVAHTRKSPGGSADDTVLGSRAFTGLARAVHHVFRDPERRRRRLMLPGKNNLGEEMAGLAFRLEGSPLPSVVFDDEPVTITADEMAGHRIQALSERNPGQTYTARDGVTDWLYEILDHGTVSAAQVREHAKAAGLAWRTVQRAAQELKVRPRRNGFATGGWFWALPELVEPDNRDVKVAALLS